MWQNVEDLLITARKKLGRGESQMGEDKKVRREKMQVREKVGKS